MAIAPVETLIPGPNQTAFIAKARQTILNVADEAFKTLDKSRTMAWPVFAATYIESKQQALRDMDVRTSKIFLKMMKPINLQIDANTVLKEVLKIFEMVSQDSQISKKYVEGIALPHVKIMVAELDAINESIINDAISS